MSSRPRRPAASLSAAGAADGGRGADQQVPVVGGREPCPCGSGRRYKACHGRSRGDVLPPAARPFAGRVDECDLVALREVVPSATAPLRLKDSDRQVLLGTVLPVAWPAMSRADGRSMLGLQTAPRSGDLNRDLGQALLAVLDADPGQGLDQLPAPTEGPGLTDLLDPDPLDITVHAGFDWWLEGVDEPGAEATQALERANAGVVPTVRLSSVTAAYWCRIGDRCHLRWAMPEGEEALLDAFARLAHARAFDLGESTRYVGAFRALGLVLPVWDLPVDRTPEQLEAPAATLRARLDEALAEARPLTADERRTRAGVVSRQLTLR